jgi:hypothetical protein
MLMVFDQTIFMPRNGYIGIGSPALEVGDEIMVLFGSRVPFILRPVDNRSPGAELEENGALKSHYMSLNDCYVHGIMQGGIFVSTHMP